jgi:hypothetical protein
MNAVRDLGHICDEGESLIGTSEQFIDALDDRPDRPPILVHSYECGVSAFRDPKHSKSRWRVM